MNKAFLKNEYLMPTIILAGLLLVLLGYIFISNFIKSNNANTPTTKPSQNTASTKPKVYRIDLSSNASKNTSGYNAAEQTGLSENQSVNLVREQFTDLSSEYDVAFDRVDVKDGKKYNVVKIYYKEYPDAVISWCYVDPETKKAYRLDDKDNMLYEIKRYNPNINRTIIDKVETNEVGE